MVGGEGLALHPGCPPWKMELGNWRNWRSSWRSFFFQPILCKYMNKVYYFSLCMLSCSRFPPSLAFDGNALRMGQNHSGIKLACRVWQVVLCWVSLLALSISKYHSRIASPAYMCQIIIIFTKKPIWQLISIYSVLTKPFFSYWNVDQI